MVKGKRNGLTFTECSVKICRILLLSPPYWKWSYHNATQSECAHRLDDNIFQIDRSLVLMRAFFLLSSFWWFIKRANLIAARIYSQATEAHWKKTDVFYSPWAKCCMRNESDALHVQANSYTTFMLESFYFMKAFTRKNEFVMFHYFLFIIIKTYSTIAFYILKV